MEKSSQKYKPVAAAHPTNAGAELEELLSLELSLELELITIELLSLLLWLELTLELIELLSVELERLELMLEASELDTDDDIDDDRLETSAEDMDEETEDDELPDLPPPPQAVSTPAKNKLDIN